jgi:RNA polymerase sigma-70 factor, ECF subfamily
MATTTITPHQADCSLDQQASHREAEMTDEQLLLEYRATGDRNLFAALVHRYERELYNYLCRYLGNAEMAEDVFQIACILLHKKCNQFQEGRRFRPWLYAIATNAGIDYQRSNKRHRAVSLDRAGLGNDDSARLADTLVSESPDPHSQASRLEDGEWVQHALDQLSDQMRTVVQLVYYQGLKYREAADALDIPVGTVKSRLNTAIRRLNEYWDMTHSEDS